MAVIDVNWPGVRNWLIFLGIALVVIYMYYPQKAESGVLEKCSKNILEQTQGRIDMVRLYNNNAKWRDYNVTVTRVDRVVAPKRRARFERERARLKSETGRDPIKANVYHGSRRPDLVIKNGFDLSKVIICGILGKGHYTSASFDYSLNYSKKLEDGKHKEEGKYEMFVCDIIKGKCENYFSDHRKRRKDVWLPGRSSSDDSDESLSDESESESPTGKLLRYPEDFNSLEDILGKRRNYAVYDNDHIFPKLRVTFKVEKKSRGKIDKSRRAPEQDQTQGGPQIEPQ